MTKHTIASESDPSLQRLQLHELALIVAPIHCQRRYEAIAVLDGDQSPPAEWANELESRRLEFIESNLADGLKEFNSSDYFIASHFLGIPGTEFDAWKKRTRDWKAQIARLRKTKREGFETENRENLEDRALDTVTSQMASEREEAATKALQQALRAKLMAQDTTVRATPEAGERRHLDRAEIAEAGIDHVNNKLEVDGRWWCNVEVECKGHRLKRKVPPPESHPVDDETVMTWLKDQISARRKKNEDTIRPTMIWRMRDQFRAQGLTRERAGKIYGKLPQPYKGTPGPSPKSNTD